MTFLGGAGSPRAPTPSAGMASTDVELLDVGTLTADEAAEVVVTAFERVRPWSGFRSSASRR